jgi:uncharacterized protein
VRVVLDPNVLISASIAPRGIPKALLDAWTKRRFELIVSPELLAELEDVLSRERLRRWLTQEEVTAFVAKLRLGATLVDDPPTGRTPITADPDDDYLVALAQAARADYLVSGDRHLIELPDPDPPVLTPRQLLERLPTPG